MRLFLLYHDDALMGVFSTFDKATEADPGDWIKIQTYWWRPGTEMLIIPADLDHYGYVTLE